MTTETTLQRDLGTDFRVAPIVHEDDPLAPGLVIQKRQQMAMRGHAYDPAIIVRGDGPWTVLGLDGDGERLWEFDFLAEDTRKFYRQTAETHAELAQVVTRMAARLLTEGNVSLDGNLY